MSLAEALQQIGGPADPTLAQVLLTLCNERASIGDLQPDEIPTELGRLASYCSGERIERTGGRIALDDVYPPSTGGGQTTVALAEHSVPQK